MKRASIVLGLFLILGALTAPAYGKPGLPKLTGGGEAANNDAGAGATTQFGFTARATGAGVVTPHPPFTQSSTVYPADGEFQVRSIDANNNTLSKGHGDVVCVANFGPSSGVDGGGNPGGDIWEVRVAFDADGTTVYGSFLMQDNGKVDYMDESFAASRLFDDDCGEVTLFQVEEVIHGQINAL